MSRGHGRIERTILEAIDRGDPPLVPLLALARQSRGSAWSFRRAGALLEEEGLLTGWMVPLPTQFLPDGAPIRSSTRLLFCVSAPAVREITPAMRTSAEAALVRSGTPAPHPSSRAPGAP